MHDTENWVFKICFFVLHFSASRNTKSIKSVKQLQLFVSYKNNFQPCIYLTFYNFAVTLVNASS